MYEIKPATGPSAGKATKTTRFSEAKYRWSMDALNGYEPTLGQQEGNFDDTLITWAHGRPIVNARNCTVSQEADLRRIVEDYLQLAKAK